MSEQIAIDILSASGQKVGSKDLSAQVFRVDPNLGIIHESVRQERAKAREGTHCVKTRAQVAGGGKKPWKQKGTGQARAGSNTSPLWVGGGVAHGPKQRSYEFSMNKKERRQALSGVLSVRLAQGKLLAVDSLGLQQIKTSDAAKVLSNLGLRVGEKTLVILPAAKDEVAEKSLRNIAGVKVLTSAGLNAYDLTNSVNIVVVGDALTEIEARLN